MIQLLSSLKSLAQFYNHKSSQSVRTIKLRIQNQNIKGDIKIALMTRQMKMS